VLRSPSVGARYGGSAAAAATAVAGEQSSGAAAVVVGGGDDPSPVPTVGFVTGMPGSVMEAGESKVRRESKTRQETPSSFNLRWCHSTATKNDIGFTKTGSGQTRAKLRGENGAAVFRLFYIAPLLQVPGGYDEMVFGLPRWTWIDRVRESMIASPLGKKTHIYRYIYMCLLRNANSKLLEMIVLPRQARDKRRESTHNQSAVTVFSLFCSQAATCLPPWGSGCSRCRCQRPTTQACSTQRCACEGEHTLSSLFGPVILLRDTIILPRQARDKHDEISRR
jgi:hypothetical protein